MVAGPPAARTGEARPLTVLVVHNRYRQRGGEDAVVDAEIKLLRDAGHRCELFERSSHEATGMPAAGLALQTIWSTESARAFERRIAELGPDVVHVHNTFPLVSPSVYWAARRGGVPVVQTLHNFRIACPQAMFLRDGRVCEDCKGRLPWPGVVHRCYQGSAARTAVIAGMQVLHRALGTWRDKVDRYIALNEFCRRKFIEAGLPAERIVIKPNFVDLPRPPRLPRDGLLFVGRLSPEKGIATLARAAGAAPGVGLRVAGTGPSLAELDGLDRVALLGEIDAAQVHRHMTGAVALVLPSVWYENFPRTLVEAFACGLPVIASRIGALAELVDEGRTGLLFEPGSADELAERMRWALANPLAMRVMGDNARAEYERRYAPPGNLARLLEIYGSLAGCRGPVPARPSGTTA